MAHLDEDVDEDLGDPCGECWSARFSGFVERPGHRVGRAPSIAGATLADAVRWGETLADVVLVYVRDLPADRYWAGKRAPPADWRAQPLPGSALALRRRRPPGRAWCDRVDTDPEVLWPVGVDVFAPPDRRARLSRRGPAVVRHLLNVPKVEDARRRRGPVDWEWETPATGPRVATFSVTVRAATRTAASSLAEAACHEAFIVAGRGSEALRLRSFAGPPLIEESDGGPDAYTRRRWG